MQDCCCFVNGVEDHSFEPLYVCMCVCMYVCMYVSWARRLNCEQAVIGVRVSTSVTNVDHPKWHSARKSKPHTSRAEGYAAATQDRGRRARGRRARRPTQQMIHTYIQHAYTQQHDMKHMHSTTTSEVTIRSIATLE
jgi:hypothetical protein